MSSAALEYIYFCLFVYFMPYLFVCLAAYLLVYLFISFLYFYRVVVDRHYVRERVKKMLLPTDLSRFIL